ncbi:MAG: DUF1249 domain-containing protein [bacterium]
MALTTNRSIQTLIKQDNRLEELMQIYEANYQRLQILLDTGHKAGWKGVSKQPNTPDLFARIDEQHRYTTMLHLSHRFSEDGKYHQEPDTFIRIYHDARTAEAVQISPGTNVTELLRPWVPSKLITQRRRELNWFLLKWLNYLIERGHTQKTFKEVE